jgi:hypothetical protein
MAQHAAQRPMRARLAIGTGLLAAGMLLVAPAATAFAGPGSCTGSANKTAMQCHHNGRDFTETAGGATPAPSPMSRQPCAKPAPANPAP